MDKSFLSNNFPFFVRGGISDAYRNLCVVINLIRIGDLSYLFMRIIKAYLVDTPIFVQGNVHH